MTFDNCEDRVILTKADTGTGVPFGAALTQDDVARDDGFATELFHAQTTTRAIATVTGATTSSYSPADTFAGELMGIRES